MDANPFPDEPRIPALALTAYGGSLQRELAISVGFDDYMKKPFAPQDLVRAVAGIARRQERSNS